MTSQLKAILLASIFALSAPVFAEGTAEGAAEDTVGGKALSARQIMEKVRDIDLGDNAHQDLVMQITDQYGKTREQKAKIFRKNNAETDEMHTAIFFTNPASMKGMAYLSYDSGFSDKNDRRWLYLPKLNKTKRVAAGDKSLAFMNSDFSYADISMINIDSYTYEIVGEKELNGEATWIIDSTPINKEVIDENGYTKSTLYIHKESFLVLRSENYVKKGNKMKYMNVYEFENIDGVWVQQETVMETYKANKKLSETVMKLENNKFNQKMRDEMFTVHGLRRGID